MSLVEKVTSLVPSPPGIGCAGSGWWGWARGRYDSVNPLHSPRMRIT